MNLDLFIKDFISQINEDFSSLFASKNLTAFNNPAYLKRSQDGATQLTASISSNTSSAELANVLYTST